MHKLIVAITAILVTGVFGIAQLTDTDAQDARRGDQPHAPEVRRVEQRQNIQFMNQGQPGTWQAISHEDELILLNTATGESFMLDDNDNGPFWRPIPRPNAGRRDVPRDMQRSTPDAAPNRSPEQIERRLNELRERVKNSDGEARERAQNAIHELEGVLRKLRDDKDNGRSDKDREDNDRSDRDGNRDDRKGEIEDSIHDLKDRLQELNDKFDDTDNERKRDDIEKEIKSVKEKISALKKELKGLKD